MADTALILGLVGVTGTIVGTATGAIIAARSTTAVEARREARVRREEFTSLRGAARLVWLDLLVAHLWLRAHDCDFVQDYLLARPVAAEQLAAQDGWRRS